MKYGVVPAGGLGTRMTLTSTAKELLPVAGRPVIEYILERLALLNPSRIFVTTAFDKQDLIHYLTKHSRHKNLVTVVPGPRLGLMHGIVSPSSQLKSTDDLYFGLPDTIWFPQRGYLSLSTTVPLALGLLPTDTPQLYGSVVLDKNQKIISISEKPTHPTSRWIWAFGKLKVQAALRLNHKLNFTDALGDYALKQEVSVMTFENGMYLDIGTPENYQKANSLMNKHHD